MRGPPVAALPSSAPEVVVANAVAWGRVDETGPLFRLPLHDQRMRYAVALAPWSAAPVERSSHGERALGWSPTERAALAEAMR